MSVKHHQKSFFTLWEALYLINLSYNRDISFINRELHSRGIKDILVQRVVGGQYAINGLHAVIYSRYADNKIRYFIGVAGTAIVGKNQSKFKDLLQDLSSIGSFVLNKIPEQSYDLENFLFDFSASRNFKLLIDGGAHSLGCPVIAFVVAKHPDWFLGVKLVDGPGVNELILQVQPNLSIRKDIYSKIGIYNGLPNLINTFSSHPDIAKIYCIEPVKDKIIQILKLDFSACLVLTAKTHSLEHLIMGVEQGKVKLASSVYYKSIGSNEEWPDSMLSKYKEVLGPAGDIELVHVDTNIVVGMVIEEDFDFGF
jgi:hypothetical protein